MVANAGTKLVATSDPDDLRIDSAGSAAVEMADRREAGADWPSYESEDEKLFSAGSRFSRGR